MKRYQPGRWVYNNVLDSIAYLREGEYELGAEIGRDCFEVEIPHMLLNQLISFLLEQGLIKPQFGENRAEDLKVIHRLIDVIEKRAR
jgi:hypothetical protein